MKVKCGYLIEGIIRPLYQLNNLYIGFTGSDLHLMEGGDDNSQIHSLA